MDLLRFALLGLGTGGIYALAAQGIVLVHRGSGVLNFAHGATGMVGAFCFYDLLDRGLPVVLAGPAALGLAAVLGMLQYWLVLRPLAGSSALVRLVAALSMMGLLQAFGVFWWGSDSRLVAPLLPHRTVTLVDGATMGIDRYLILGIAVVVTVGLTVIYRRTRFGLATAAVAESPRSAEVHGVLADRVAGVNWAAGAALATTAGVLIAPIAGLQVNALTLLVIPAIAAALVGRFRSFIWTTVAAVAMGVGESVLTRYVTTPGAARSIPMLVIVGVLVIGGGALEVRGRQTPRAPRLGSGRIGPVSFCVAALGVVGLLAVHDDLAVAASSSLTMALVLLSIVVVTGYAGQVSLAQFTLAGMAAWVASRLVADHGTPVLLAAIAGVLAAVVLGTAIGLTATRSRGVSLAIATLALSLVLQETILRNSDRTGGILGTTVGRFELLGLDLTAFDHPQRYAAACAAVLLVASVAVANLRRGRTGLRFVAVRTNERAAAALGVEPSTVKLQSFALASGIAALAGVLLAFRNPTVTFEQFDVFNSITAVALAVTGGVGFVAGVLIGGVGATGGVFTSFVRAVSGGSVPEVVAVVVAAGSVLVVVRDPDGIADRVARLVARRRRPSGQRPAADTPVDDFHLVVAAATLEVRGLGVRFGGVVAVDDVGFCVDPGEVVGLIGPNGAGKTTTIDAITGFVQRSTGAIRLGDWDVSGWSPARRARHGLGRTFQSLELFDGLTVRDNLRVAAGSCRWWAWLVDLVHPGGRELPPHVLAMVGALGLRDDLDRTVESLSLGRRRMVALARALAPLPSVVLLDEPAAGLDEHERAELAAVIRMAAARWGCGVLLVEHDVALVFELCDRVEVLDFGRHIASGPAAAIRTDPVVAAAYLGVGPEAGDGEVANPQAVSCSSKSAMESVPVLEVHGGSFGYGGTTAVAGVDLCVYAGRITAFVGPNGAGKTATVLGLVGAVEPLAGRVDLHGRQRPVGLARAVGAGIGVVFDDRSVLTDLTVAEGLRLSGADQAAALATFPELGPLLHRRAGLLSGGEQQILALARALATEPSVLVVDELSHGLAPLVVERLFVALRAAADRGLAVLVVEQQVNAVLRYADNVVVVARGRVQHAGPASALDAALVRDLYLDADAADSPSLVADRAIPAPA
ncbi:MAG: hypothetical protein QOG75_1921 [Mycobacterium sp.]|nr:hypothetical protein [Mycobacterium sp.]